MTLDITALIQICVRCDEGVTIHNSDTVHGIRQVEAGDLENYCC